MTPEEIVRSFLEHLARQETDAAVALLADDGVGLGRILTGR